MDSPRIKIRIKGKGDSRQIWAGGRLVGRIERRDCVEHQRRTDEDGRSYVERKVHNRWRGWDAAGRNLGELRSIVAWKRWFEGHVSRKAVVR